MTHALNAAVASGALASTAEAPEAMDPAADGVTCCSSAMAFNAPTLNKVKIAIVLIGNRFDIRITPVLDESGPYDRQ
ncbi:hypothetical protein [Ralstonia solanacearum]|uniref:hypothetical protein n=1 Tax=Ralstonia solanacearum TaxID=305 RepID=UPI001FF72058|nr:hypothetical protein [Ralstonia solanacearum]